MVRPMALGRPAAWLLGGALVLGCAASEEERAELRLADLKSATMQVRVITEGRFGAVHPPIGIWVEVTFQGAPADCFTFAPEVRATLAGHDMSPSFGPPGSDACGGKSFWIQPHFSPGLDVTAVNDDVVELSDGRDVFRATVKGLTVFHGLSWLAPRLDPIPLRAGETMALDWHPRTDLFMEEPGVQNATFTLRDRTGIWTHFQQMPVLACEGPAACEARAHFARSLDVDVYRP